VAQFRRDVVAENEKMKQIPAILFLLGAAPAMAFDTSQLGQGGSLFLSDIASVIGSSPGLRREVDQQLSQSKKKADEVMCNGNRFPGQWTHLGGERVSPYICDFGGKWLQIKATVQLSDGRGRTFETITPEAMKSARKVKETNLNWKWTDEEPPDSD
jgi:hypothetical protein